MYAWTTILTFWLLCVVCTFSIAKVFVYISCNGNDKSEVDLWLEEQDLLNHEGIFKKKGNLTTHFTAELHGLC